MTVSTHLQTTTQHADDCSVKMLPTDLFPHLGIPTVWMMYTATWKKKTKKKKKKLKELSDLKRKKYNNTKDMLLILFSIYKVDLLLNFRY